MEHGSGQQQQMVFDASLLYNTADRMPIRCHRLLPLGHHLKGSHSTRYTTINNSPTHSPSTFHRARLVTCSGSLAFLPLPPRNFCMISASQAARNKKTQHRKAETSSVHDLTLALPRQDFQFFIRREVSIDAWATLCRAYNMMYLYAML